MNTNKYLLSALLIVISLFSHCFASNHSNSIKSLIELSEYQISNNLYKDAISTNQRILNLFIKEYGIKSIKTFYQSYSLMCLYEDIEDYKAAIEIGTFALEIIEDSEDKPLEDYAKLLGNLANYFSHIGNYQEAIRLGNQALKIRNEIFGNNSSSYAMSLNNLAHYYAELGDYTEAINLGTQALKIRKIILGENHPDFIISLSNLANYKFFIGDYQEAIRLGLQALTLKQKSIGKQTISYIISLNNISNYYAKLGNYQEAIKLATIALNIGKELLGEYHSDYANTLNSIASYYADLGNYVEAIKLGTKVFEIRKEILGENHPSFATSIANLANYYSYAGDYQIAIKLGFLSLKITKDILGERHPNYARQLNNLAQYYFFLNDYDHAVRLENKSLGIIKDIIGEKNLDYCISLVNLANYYQHTRDYKEAIKLGLKSVNISKQIFGKNHLNFLISYINLINIYFSAKDKNRLKESSHNIYPQFYNFIRSHFTYLTSNERHLFFEKYNYVFENIHKYVYTYPEKELIECGYNSALFSKGILLNSEQEFTKFIEKTESEELKNDYNDILNLRLQLNKLYEKPIADRFIDTDSLERRAIKLERTLMEKSKEFGDYTKGLSISLADVKNKLKENDAAIEFVSFPVSNDSSIYMAYILKKDLDIPIVVNLFEEKDILSMTDFELYEDSKGCNLIWGKLISYLKGVKNIYFSPDQVLHQIAIEHFPDIDGVGMFSDRYNLYRLSSTREIALNRHNNTSNNATIYGGISYDSEIETMKSENKKFPQTISRGFKPYYNIADSLSLRSGVKYLKYTLREAEIIDSLMTENSYNQLLISGKEATEESFKRQSGIHKNIIHISTHGFYWEKDLAEDRAKKNDNLLFMTEIGNDSQRNVEDKALTRSGLLMAGANNALSGKELPEDVDDGILTAQEIANLDLRGLDLVVLSACQTGMGDISGDGVFGLQRGFKKAGANSILMSLWDVDDEATQILMTEFYKNYLGGMSKRESLLAAQKIVRETPGFEDPEYWAAFILLDALN